MTERNEDGTFVADEDDLPEDVLERSWKSYDKYVCGICEGFHTLNDPAAVVEHIEDAHK